MVVFDAVNKLWTNIIQTIDKSVNLCIMFVEGWERGAPGVFSWYQKITPD